MSSFSNPSNLQKDDFERGQGKDIIQENIVWRTSINLGVLYQPIINQGKNCTLCLEISPKII